jgi:N-acetylneuraminic acid mutarotase
MPLSSSRRMFLSATVLQGELYAIGGLTPPQSATAAVASYETARATWRPRPSLSLPRAGATSATVRDRIYVAGGGGVSPSMELECFDPAVDVWQSREPMPGPRGEAASASIGSKFYVVGGYDGSIVRDNLWVYTP